MAQITFRGKTATVAAYGADLTTKNAQILPSWAPPIEYIGSTTPWLVNVDMPTTTYGLNYVHKQAKVRAYGRSATVNSGADCIALDDGFTGGVNKSPLITVTYLAVGELVKP